MGTFANSEDPDEMQHNAVRQLNKFVKVKKRSSDKIIQFIF